MAPPVTTNEDPKAGEPVEEPVVEGGRSPDLDAAPEPPESPLAAALTPPTPTPGVIQPSAAPAAERKRRPESPAAWEGPIAVLWLTAPYAPLCATVVSVVAYLLLALPIDTQPAVPQVPIAAMTIGVVATAVLWVLVVLAGRPMTSAPSAQQRLYQELAHRYKNARDRLAQISPGNVQPSVEARNSLLYAQRALIGEENGPALRWAHAYGYVGVLRAIHRVEQEILVLEPREDLLGDIEHDELSLSRSTIDNRDILLGILASARTALNGLAGAVPGRIGPKDRATEAEARSKCANVRRSIELFRDDAREGLVRVRSQMQTWVIVLGWFTFLMFGLGVLAGAPPVYLMTAAALYLVGVGAAMTGRLRIGARQSSLSEDFGLGQVRLMATLLMSGLAAVGGVYLIALLPSLMPAQGTTISPVPALSTIFDLRTNTAALLYAALFGLLPETLTNALLRGADKLQSDLASSRPANTDR
jgi:hypothetical protein